MSALKVYRIVLYSGKPQALDGVTSEKVPAQHRLFPKPPPPGMLVDYMHTRSVFA